MIKKSVLFLFIVVFMGLIYFSVPAETDSRQWDFAAKNPGSYPGANNCEIYTFADFNNLHIYLEHYKEKNGFTPVVIVMDNMEIMRWMDNSGSVIDRVDRYNRYESQLFRIDLKQRYILTVNEEIPFEITAENNMRTRLRIKWENAHAVVKVDKDKKRGVLFLFNTPVEIARLYFLKKETVNGEEEVYISGPHVHGLEKFVFKKKEKTIYSLRTYKHLEKIKESAKKKVSLSSLNRGQHLPAAERQALIALYNSTNGESWDSNGGWKEPPLETDGFAAYGSEDTWYGITVESGHVTRIFLWANDLSGTIPIELEFLSNLESLRLDYNSLAGSIPPELGNLGNLEELKLSDNSLSGSIPPELGNLSNLGILDLYSNSLSGSIPPELGNLSNLGYLDLYSNSLSGSIPPELGNLNYLRDLSLGRNSLSGSIPPELGDLSNLQSLRIYSNSLSGSIPAELGNLSYLGWLYLYDNSLSGSIPPELGNLSNLHYLRLNSNSLSGSIPRELANISNLLYFHLSSNSLSGCIPAEFGNFSILAELYLDQNSLSGSIPAELGNLNLLAELYLDQNSLSGSIPAELGNLTYLERLYLDSNSLFGEIPTSLINMINPDLALDIGYNALYTNNGPLITFLNAKDPGWAETQTIAPADVSASCVDATSIRISWTPITYTGDSGGYEVYKGVTSGGPYTLYNTTIDKSVSSMTVTGLEPISTYYFVVRTRTDPHFFNQNTLTSEYCTEVPGATVPAITVTSPDGGEDWTINTTQDITWIALELSDNIHIALQQNGINTALIAKNIDPTSGSYSWTVGDCLKGSVIPGSNYKIKIKEKGTAITDTSDAPFTISPPSITVTSPNGGESWQIGTQQDITWTNIGLSNNIHIVLRQNGINTALIAKNIDPAPGSYSWTVGNCLRGTVTPGLSSKIKIMEKGTAITDTSDAPFTISPPTITVTSPNGNEYWMLGSTKNITWDSVGVYGKLKITLWEQGEVKAIGIIADDVDPAARTYSWTVGKYIGGIAPPGRSYMIKIKEKGAPVSDRSDAAFTISPII